MKRSTYSLILMDDVVAAIDRLAAQQGTEPFKFNQSDSGGTRFLRDAGAADATDFCLSDTADEFRISHPGARLRCDAFNSWFCAVQVPSDHPLQRGTAS